MAEPYTTIEALGSGPTHWFRFNAASTNIPDEGAVPVVDGLSEIADGGSFDGTYRAEADPRGDGYGVLFNGTGGLGALDTDGADSQFSVVGHTGSVGQTNIVLMRTTTNYASSSNFCIGGYSGFDERYLSFNVRQDNDLSLIRWQDSGTDDERLTDNDADWSDDLPHTLTYTTTSSTTTVGVAFFDGVKSTDSDHLEAAGSVPDGYSIGTNDSPAVGYRGRVGGSRTTGLVVYEWLIWNETLSDADIATAHAILMNPANIFATKTIRRRGRKVFSANI